MCYFQNLPGRVNLKMDLPQPFLQQQQQQVEENQNVEQSLERVLFMQGAEARLFKALHLGRPCVIKERFAKIYRQPELDDRLSRERNNSEARCLVKCRKAGVDSPLVYHSDTKKHELFLEFIEGPTVKKWLLDGPTIAPLIQNEPPDAPAPLPRWAEPVAFAIGEAIAKIHNINLVHGDLTTSNMILRGGQRYHIDGIFDTTAEPTRLALLDFGLSSAAGSTEEKGVDLYVLERALLSTHTKIAVSFFDAVLKVYYETLTPGSVSAIKAKFEAVRLRGRKRLFFG